MADWDVTLVGTWERRDTTPLEATLVEIQLNGRADRATVRLARTRSDAWGFDYADHGTFKIALVVHEAPTEAKALAAAERTVRRWVREMDLCRPPTVTFE